MEFVKEREDNEATEKSATEKEKAEVIQQKKVITNKGAVMKENCCNIYFEYAFIVSTRADYVLKIIQ